jgi:hypothetical protein
MSYEIVSSILLVDHEDTLLLALNSASNNVSPRTPEWGFMSFRFESEAAAKGLLFGERLSGGFVFTSTLARVARYSSKQLREGLVRSSLNCARVVGALDRLLSVYGSPVPSALAEMTTTAVIARLQACCANSYYRVGALDLISQACDALQAGHPPPNPNCAQTHRLAGFRYPVLGSVTQYGLSSEVLESIRCDPRLASEVGPMGLTALHRLASAYAFEDAMQTGCLHSVRSLLLAGAVPDARDVLGQTPLHHAALSGIYAKEAVSLLLSSGLDVNAKDASGETALHLAARRGRQDTVEYLLAQGASLVVRNADGALPCHLAAANSKVQELLLPSDPPI